ncbi:oxygen-dependent protoporphyrinogen oxidase [Leucobacter komagatae]|uniref:Oxygen-dependent protoporphyrinogen oxidase n=1 Tax=Leucobacter komagatae TaxID=55969 RepID=A0A542Y717_9MICO|nr:hypothetical protein [Leucobacter komagatae]TQL43890.1 oxygen-dependent protoporphyrinogen oxidase [Leucobacter komagatae]
MTDVLLVGGGIPAYAAALDLAEVGVRIHVADAEFPLPATAVHERDGDVRLLLAEMAAPLTPEAHPNPVAAPRHPETGATAIRSRAGSWTAEPAGAIWGIPPVPLATDCIAVLGMRGALRAYLDRLKPVLTIGKEPNLGTLVDSRFGSGLRETLVDPFVFERFGVRAHDAEVALVEPGLNEALTRAGSLSGAVALQAEAHAARDRVIEPAAGWQAFATELRDRLTLYSAVPFEGDVATVEPHDDGWTVTDGTGATTRFDAVLGDLASLAGVVADAPALTGPDASSLSELLRAAQPALVRQYAEVGIQWDGAAVADAASEYFEALFLVSTEGGTTWAARAAHDAHGGARLRLAGPVGAPGNASTPPVAAALQALGATEIGGSRRWTVAAPFASDADREASSGARNALAVAFPSLIVADEELHGGELGYALAEARAHAVLLRRKLTGISE